MMKSLWDLGFASAAGFRDIVRRFSRAIYETPG
jgi:hypothetical protein